MEKCCRLLYVIVGLMIGAIAISQDRPDLDASLIPEVMKKRAHAVVRFDNTTVHLKAQDSYEVIYSSAITLMSDNGKRFLPFRARYKEGSEKIKDITVSYYDAKGVLIKTPKSKEIKDEAYNSNIELIGDQRVKTYSQEAVSYPLTIFVSYTKQSKNTMHLPMWVPMAGYNVSVIASSYSFINQTNIPIRSHFRNLKDYSSVSSNKNFHEMKGQVAKSKEDFSPSFYDVFPLALYTPMEYSFEGYQGGHSDWQDWGSWMYDAFLSDKNDLDMLRVKADVQRQIPSGLQGKALVKALYDFVQEQTRYILITLDEGGFAPLTAQKVHDVKYGDCKALSFYMKSLLNLFGISSTYVAIHASSDKPVDFFADYAATMPGNHIILNVPMGADTIWLDCTSNDNPFNYLGSFTDDRLAVEIKPEGGRLIQTPRYDISQNRHSVNATVLIDVDGGIAVSYESQDFGLFYENGIWLRKKSEKDFDEYLLTSFLNDFDRVEVVKHQLDLIEDEVRFDQMYEFNAKRYGEKAGQYMIFPFRFFDLEIPKLKKDSHREQEIFFPRDENYRNETKYILPDGYKMKVPKVAMMKDQYGSYSREVTEIKPGEYLVKREFQLFKGRYDADKYDSIKRFFDKIRKAERAKFSINNKT